MTQHIPFSDLHPAKKKNGSWEWVVKNIMTCSVWELKGTFRCLTRLGYLMLVFTYLLTDQCLSVMLTVSYWLPSLPFIFFLVQNLARLNLGAGVKLKNYLFLFHPDRNLNPWPAVVHASHKTPAAALCERYKWKQSASTMDEQDKARHFGQH